MNLCFAHCLTKTVGKTKIIGMTKDKVTLKIPRPLYDKLKKVLEGSGFSSVNEFVVYVLRDLVSSGLGTEGKPSNNEDDAIRDRLKNLGYF